MLSTNCLECGKEKDLFYRCSYCEGTYCSNHRLPEAHACDGVRFLSDSGKPFESKFSDEIVTQRDEIEPPKPFKPRYTVGTTPEPAWDPSPDNVLKSVVDSNDPQDYENTGGLLRFFRRFLNR